MQIIFMKANLDYLNLDPRSNFELKIFTSILFSIFTSKEFASLPQ